MKRRKVPRPTAARMSTRDITTEAEYLHCISWPYPPECKCSKRCDWEFMRRKASLVLLCKKEKNGVRGEEESYSSCNLEDDRDVEVWCIFRDREESQTRVLA